jgi:hypothetical protein
MNRREIRSEPEFSRSALEPTLALFEDGFGKASLVRVALAVRQPAKRCVS